MRYVIICIIILSVYFYQIGSSPAPETPIVQIQSTIEVDALVAAVIDQESGGNPAAVGAAGEIGLMQIMPATAAGIAARMGVASYDLDDPETNVSFGTFYLNEKLSQYGDVRLALAAYNCGNSCVDNHIANGAPLPASTERYVAAILARLPQEPAQPIEQPASTAGAPRGVPVVGDDIIITQGYSAGHPGLDYAAAGGPGATYGLPVVATHSGTAHISDTWPCGLGVMVNGADGYVTLYCHLAEVTVAHAAPVEAGHQIGSIGNTGLSTGPHLHYEIRVHGANVDPSGY